MNSTAVSVRPAGDRRASDTYSHSATLRVPDVAEFLGELRRLLGVMALVETSELAIEGKDLEAIELAIADRIDAFERDHPELGSSKPVPRGD